MQYHNPNINYIHVGTYLFKFICLLKRDNNITCILNYSTRLKMSTGGCREFPRIKVVRAFVADNKLDNTIRKDQGADCHDVDDSH